MMHSSLKTTLPFSIETLITRHSISFGCFHKYTPLLISNTSLILGKSSTESNKTENQVGLRTPLLVQQGTDLNKRTAVISVTRNGVLTSDALSQTLLTTTFLNYDS